MSRFKGWNAAAIEKLTGEKILSKPAQNIPKNIPEQPNFVKILSNALLVIGIEHRLEYKFLHDRRFRFDIAIPQYRVAVEFEGGIFTGGRHTRGKGYAKDAKKYNLAVMHNWKLLRYTSADVRKMGWEFIASGEIQRLIEKIKLQEKNYTREYELQN